MNTFNQILEMTHTPEPIPPEYDWRKELWVDEGKVRDLSYYIAHHILTAIAVDGDDDQGHEDQQVALLLSPQVTERVWKSEEVVLRARVALAATIGVDRMITRWIEVLGSVDAKNNRPKGQTP